MDADHGPPGHMSRTRQRPSLSHRHRRRRRRYPLDPTVYSAVSWPAPAPSSSASPRRQRRPRSSTRYFLPLAMCAARDSDTALLLPLCLPGATPCSPGACVTLNISGSGVLLRGPDRAFSGVASSACPKQAFAVASFAMWPSRGRPAAVPRVVGNHICEAPARWRTGDADASPQPVQFDI